MKKIINLTKLKSYLDATNQEHLTFIYRLLNDKRERDYLLERYRLKTALRFKLKIGKKETVQILQTLYVEYLIDNDFNAPLTYPEFVQTFTWSGDSFVDTTNCDVLKEYSNELEEERKQTVQNKAMLSLKCFISSKEFGERN